MTNCNYTLLSNFELIDIIKTFTVACNKLNKFIQTNNDKLYKEILDRTSFLSKSASIHERIYCIQNNLTTIPICKNPSCTNFVKWNTHANKYNSYCCNKCVGKDPKVVAKRINSYIETFGTDNPMKSEAVKKKQQQTVVEHFGVKNVSKSIQIQEKRECTIEQKFGNKCMFKTDYFQNKLNKYLADNNILNVSQLDSVKQKVKTTHEQLYGGIGMGSTELAYKTINKTIELYDKTPIQILLEASHDIIKSKKETELGEYIKTIYPGDVQFNVRSILQSKKELDIWIPERRIAIEFNGDYWHMNPKLYSESDYNSNINMTAKQKWEYDELKINECQQMGIELIVVWEHDWVHDKEQVKTTLQNKINDV